jgi:hypothetical protein
MADTKAAVKGTGCRVAISLRENNDTNYGIAYSDRVETIIADEAQRVAVMPSDSSLSSYKFYLTDRFKQKKSYTVIKPTISYKSAELGFGTYHIDYLSDMSSMIKDSLLLELLIDSHKEDHQFFKDNSEAILNALTDGGRKFYGSPSIYKGEGIDMFRYSPLTYKVQDILSVNTGVRDINIPCLAFIQAQQSSCARAISNFVTGNRDDSVDGASLCIDVLAPMLKK